MEWRRRESNPRKISIEIWNPLLVLPLWIWSLAHQHRGGLAFQVDVVLAAHVDSDAADRSAREPPGHLARVVGGDAGAAVAADAQALPGKHEFSWLGLERTLPDFRI